MKLYFIFCCLCICRVLNAQSDLPPFGQYSQAESEMKECSFDKNAEAVVIFDEARSSPDGSGNHELLTHRRLRIKILDKREIARGNISISFYSGDEYEYIDNIRGVTFNPGDEHRHTYLDTASIYTEKEDNYYSKIKFALPNVKAGSIIEYEYDSHKKTYGALKNWIFQHDIPTLKSCYLLEIIFFSQFQYSLHKKPGYPVIVKKPTPSTVYFEMNNIPALRFEPFMDAPRDYLQRVDFKLASINIGHGSTQVSRTWKQLAVELINSKDFGGPIKKDLPDIEEIKQIVSAQPTDSGKIAAVYNYVRNNFTWNGYYSIYATDGLKNVWGKKEGTSGEINLILINLLRYFKMDVRPMLAAERDFGKIDINDPFLDRFNKVVAYAKAGNKNFILDATQKFCPPDLPPFPLLNTIGFVVDGRNSKLIGILNKGNTYKNVIAIDGVLNDKGELRGTARITSTDYAKQIRSKGIKADSKKFIKETLQEQRSDLVVDDFTFSHLDDDSKPLVQEIKFHQEFNVSGGFVLFMYNLFTGLSKNPFTASERFTNINFGYPYNINMTAKIKLPEKIHIDKLPEDKSIASDDASTIAYRTLKIDNNTLTVNIAFRQSTTLVDYDKYAEIKSVYILITELLNDPVVIKISD